MTKAMIKSMTGFGRCENHQGSRKFTVEMKAVNHRYFDVSIKMPKKLSFFEAGHPECPEAVRAAAESWTCLSRMKIMRRRMLR